MNTKDNLKTPSENTFNSDFAIFLPIVFILYWFATRKNLNVQNFLIVASSYLFYGQKSPFSNGWMTWSGSRGILIFSFVWGTSLIFVTYVFGIILSPLLIAQPALPFERQNPACLCHAERSFVFPYPSQSHGAVSQVHPI